MSTQAMQDQIMGNWGELKGRVKQQWGQLTDDELRQAEGSFDQLVGLIQRKTGETRQQVEQSLGELADQGNGILRQAGDTARRYADEASHRLRDAGGMARERMMQGYGSARELVRDRPTESIAAAFGTGVLLGVMIGLMIGMGTTQSYSNERRWW